MGNRSLTLPASGVLYVIACAAPPARHVDTLIRLAQAEGWDVGLVLTPRGSSFVNVEFLAELTGHPVRIEYKTPGAPDVLPPPDAMIVAPATFNTINKWAAGISDTLALGLLTEAVGKALPLVALPFVNTAQARHPAFQRSVAELKEMGVNVLFGPDIYPLHEPGKGSEYLHLYPWHLSLDALAEAQST